MTELDGLVGCKTTKVSKGVGSFLTIDLDRELETGGHESLSIWVYLCKWSITKKGEAVVNEMDVCADTDFSFMNRLTINRIIYSEKKNHFDFNFSKNIILHIEPDLSIYHVYDDLFMLTDSDGKTKGYSPALGWKT